MLAVLADRGLLINIAGSASNSQAWELKPACVHRQVPCTLMLVNEHRLFSCALERMQPRIAGLDAGPVLANIKAEHPGDVSSAALYCARLETSTLKK